MKWLALLLLCGCTQTYCRDESTPEGWHGMHCWERCLHVVCVQLGDHG